MDAKQYLEQIKDIQTRLEYLVKQRDYLKARAEYSGISYSDMPHAATRNAHKNEEAIIDLIDWNDKIAEQCSKLNEINRAISEVSAPTAQAILVRKYVCGETWEQISKALYISRSRLFELHKSALREIEKSGRFVPISDD